MIGKLLGHQKIRQTFGHRGLTEFYNAEHSNLHCHVAIMVLANDFAHDAEPLAPLNHPNIALIHGFVESDGKRFILMELAHRKTLAQRLLKGPLALNEDLATCRRIAARLEASDQKRVNHRDLKPANITLTDDDTFRILDFGLLTGLPAKRPLALPTQSPTIIEAVTGARTILHTPPKQSDVHQSRQHTSFLHQEPREDADYYSTRQFNT